MAPDTIAKLASDGIGIIIIPFFGWVVVSIYNQRQEIALLKQAVDDLKAVNKMLVKALMKEGMPSE